MTKNKTILITGVSSGIGLETAVLCKDKGMKVAGTYRNEKPTDPRLEGITLVHMDLDENPSIIAGYMEAQVELDMHIDYLFCNAGFGLPGAFEDLSNEDLQYQFQTNVFSVQTIIKMFMKRNGHDKKSKVIVNSSVLGFTAAPYRGAYVASKFALEGLIGCLKSELKRINSGISIDIIQPGPIATNFKKRSLEEFKRYIIPSRLYRNDYLKMEKRLDKSYGKMAKQPEDVAKVVFSLLEKDANHVKRITFITSIAWLIKRFLPNNLQEHLVHKTSP